MSGDDETSGDAVFWGEVRRCAEDGEAVVVAKGRNPQADLLPCGPPGRMRGHGRRVRRSTWLRVVRRHRGTWAF